MSITLKRNTGWLGMGVKLTIKINGEKVSTIGYNEEIRLNIPHNNSELRVTQFGTKSNKVDVKNNDTVEITTPKLSYIVFFLVIISPTLLSSFINTAALYIVLIISTILIVFLTNTFKLKIVNKDSQDTVLIKK